MKKRVLALLLALVMTLGLVPVGALAAGEETAEITFSYSKENAVVIAPHKLSVSAGLAYQYGIGDTATTEPTVLDAVVAAHIEKYGDDFNLGTADNYVDSFLTTVFEDSGYAGHIINGHYSSDIANEAAINNGDTIDVFLYSSDYSDNYAAFYQNDSIVHNIICVAGDALQLAVQGFMVMYAYNGESWQPLSGLNIGTVNEKGGFDSLDVETVSDGSCTVVFDTPGTYTLVTRGASGSTPVIPAWCTVTVNEGLSEEEAWKIVEEDREALTLAETAESSLNLPQMGQSGKTSITWVSSDPAVISNQGSVVRQLTEQTVTLTATISCGTVRGTKEFQVTVPALDENGITARLAAARDALLQVDALDPVEYSGESDRSYPYEGSVVVDTNICTKAQKIVDQAAPGVSVALQEVKTGTDCIAADGTITYPEGYTPVQAEVTFGLSLGSNSSMTVDVAGITIPTHADTKTEAVAEKMREMSIDTILAGQSAENVTETLNLPIGNQYLGIITHWESTNSAVTMTQGSVNNNQAHKIVRPAYGENSVNVDLIATFDYSDFYKQQNMCEAGPMPALKDRQKTFTITVPAYTKEEWDQLKQDTEAALNSIVIKPFGAHSDTDPAADLSAVTEDLMLPNVDGYTTAWTSNHANIAAPTYKTGKAVVTRPAGSEDAVGELVVTITKGSYTASKRFNVTVLAANNLPEENETLTTAIENITSAYAAKDETWWGTAVNAADWWHAVAMGAYAQTHTDKLNEKQKQAFANQAIGTAAEYAAKIGSTGQEEAATGNKLGNSIIGLSAFGYDAQKITTINDAGLAAGTELAKLDMEGAKKGYFTTIAPYVLTALAQGEYQSDTLENALVDYMLSLQMSDGGWGWSTNSDVDTTAMMLQGLTLSNRTDAQQACNEGIKTMADAFANADGPTFGNANTDSMAILALAAFGIDPNSDPRFVKGGRSLVDGFLSYLTEDQSAFKGFAGTADDYATKQGLLGLLAAEQVWGKTTPFNIFDFSDVSKRPAEATGSGIVVPPDEPTGPETITTTVTIKADTGYWLNSKSVTVSEGSAVYHAFVKALDGTGITQEGAETGYITSMTKNGKTLAEFSNGPDSGWLYKVNGKLPAVGLTSCKIKDGDLIVFYYTNDWTSDPDAGGIVTPPAQNGSALTPSAPVNAKGEATAKIPDKDLTAAIDAARKNDKDIVIAPVVKGEADTVSVQLPKTGVASAAKSTDADLVVKTDLGSVTVPNEALASIAEQAAGSTVTITVAEKTAADVADKTIDTTGAVIAEVTVTSDDKEITTFDGQSLTVSIPVSGKSWTAGETYDVIVLSGSGAKETLAGRCVKADGGLAVQVEVSHLSTFIVTPNRAENIPFTDLTGHWAMDEVTTAWKLGLMNGVSGTRFAPDKTLSRAMAATILYRLAGSPASDSKLPFTDVGSGQWYSSAIAWAAGEGIVDGVKPDRFAPENNVTRQQLAAMLYRYVQTKDLGFTGDWTYDLDVTDRADVADWAYEAVCWMHQNGILKGRANGAIDPKGTATRAEAAALYVRLADILNP